MFTLDILYIHRILVFGIPTAKAAAKEKRVSRDSTNTGIPHCDLITSILRLFSMRILNRSHEIGRKLHRLVAVSCDQ